MSAHESQFTSTRYFEGDFMRPDEEVGTNYAVFMVEQKIRSPHEIIVTKADKSCKKFYDKDKAADFVKMSRFAFNRMLETNKYMEFLVTLDDLKGRFDLPRRWYSPGDILEFSAIKDSKSRKILLQVLNLTRQEGFAYEFIEQAESMIGVYKGWISEQKEICQGLPFKARVTPSRKLELYNGSHPVKAESEPPAESGNGEESESGEGEFLSYFLEDPRKPMEKSIFDDKQVFCRPFRGGRVFVTK